jgi:hypothetical protein
MTLSVGSLLVGLAVLVVTGVYVARPFRRGEVAAARAVEVWVRRARSGFEAPGAAKVEVAAAPAPAADAAAADAVATDVAAADAAEAPLGAGDQEEAQPVNFCPYCVRRVESDHRFCPGCGKSLPTEGAI